MIDTDTETEIKTECEGSLALMSALTGLDGKEAFEKSMEIITETDSEE